MDTAQKLFKTSALLFVVALLMAAPGWAVTPTLVAPATVTIGTSGSFPASVTSFPAGTTITYVAAISYPMGNSSGDWLRVKPSGTTSTALTAYLTFGLRNDSFAGVNSGASATVTLMPTIPSGVAAVTIAVTFDSTGGGGTGSTTLTASPTTVNLTAAVNSPASTTVNITTNSVSTITINQSTSVSSGAANWLSVSPFASALDSSGGSTLTITADGTSLTSGLTYQGSVIVTPSTGTPLTIPVTFAVSAGVTNGAWIATPGAVGWNFVINSGVYPASQAITVNSTSGSFTYGVNAYSGNGWLRVSAGSVADVTSLTGIGVGTPFALKLDTSANALPAGQYPGRVDIYDSAGNYQISVAVTLNVTSGNGPALTVTPNPVSLAAPLNGIPQSQTVNVTSSVGGNLSVSGTLPTGMTYQLPTNISVAPGGTLGFTVTGNPAGLVANTYTGTLLVAVGAQSATLTVTMVVGGGGTGTTAVAPTALNFSYQLGTDPTNFVARQKLVITGPKGAWSSSIATTNGGNWLKLTPSNGTSLPNPANASEAPVVTLDATGLTADIYGGIITINTAGGTQSIKVSLTVVTGAILLPTPGDLIFTAQTGQGNPAVQPVYFSSSDGTLNPLAITAVSNNSWIAVTHDERSITVQVDQTGLTTGVYSGSVAVSQTGAANSPTTIPILLVVNGGGSGGTGGGTGGPSDVNVTPGSLTFSAPSGSNPAAQTLKVNSASGSAGVPFTVQVTTGANWLSTNASGTNTTPLTNLTVSVNTGILGPNSYLGNILITPTGGSPVNVPVYLTILTGATTVTATPTTFTFDYRAGAAVPAAKPLTVSGGGAALAFSATPSSNGNWLVVSPATGTTPATVNVSINPAGLSTGSYIGTILVAGTGSAPGSSTVTVTLNVTVPLPTITKVTNAASYAVGSIAPGEIITLFASDPTHPIGPATAVSLITLDSSGKLSTTMGGVQVLINGFACPMIYVSASQVSAVVPYELKLFTTATVLVKFLGQTSNGVAVNVATTAPGMFTASSSGTGPGAILNSDSTTPNSAAFPATRGDTVVVYVTGEGETSPAGVTGKVTTVAAAPQPLTPAPLLPISVTIGGQPANWSFAGEAPGFISGLMQLNVAVPTNIAAGDQFIVVTIGGNQSQPGVTISVR